MPKTQKQKKETEENKKTRKAREVNNDSRKIYFASGKKDKTTPKILIEGNWLKEKDFEVGKTFKLTAEKGLITLQLNA